MSSDDSDLTERLQAVAREFEMPATSPADDVRRGRRRVRRNRGVMASAAVAVLALVLGSTAELGGPLRAEPDSLVPADRSGDQKDPASAAPVEPTQSARSTWCLADRSSNCIDIKGWIVYQHNGIWAVDPSKPNRPDHTVQLTDQQDLAPLEWSSDGAKLLVASFGQDGQLSVLHADGTKTEIANGGSFDGSFSPDGSQVIYSSYSSGGMWIVDTAGGKPRRLLEADPDPIYGLAFSPDGERIAYFTGRGDNSHSLRVMNSDGTGGRTLWFRDCGCHVGSPVWSPDGQRLMFALQEAGGGIWIVGADGSDATQVIPRGVKPAWSPDGTRIAYQEAIEGRFDEVSPLRIADADGSHVSKFGAGGSGAWNPLPLDR